MIKIGMEKQCLIVQNAERKRGKQDFAQIVEQHKAMQIQEDQVPHPHNRFTVQESPYITS